MSVCAILLLHMIGIQHTFFQSFINLCFVSQCNFHPCGQSLTAFGFQAWLKAPFDSGFMNVYFIFFHLNRNTLKLSTYLSPLWCIFSLESLKPAHVSPDFVWLLQNRRTTNALIATDIATNNMFATALNQLLSLLILHLEHSCTITAV